MRRVDPIAITNPVVDGWTRESLESESSWRLDLGPLSAGEAIRHLHRHGGLPSTEVRVGEFPVLTRLAAEARTELARGSGVAWIRPDFGDRLDDASWSGIFSLLCSLMGMAHRRIAARTDGLPDASMATVVVDGLVPDVVGSVWLDDPDEGDDVALVSTTALHHELEQHEPTFVRALYRSVLHTTHWNRDDIGGESARYVRAPVYRYATASRSLEFRYDRNRIELAHDVSGHPLPGVVLDAFDVVDKSVTLPHLAASLRPRRGDIVLAHNRRVVSSSLTSGTTPAVETRAMRVVNPTMRPALPPAG